MSYINISSNTTWTATGPAWVTNLTPPMIGSGNFSLAPICSPNTTGDYRSDDIVITYADGTSTTIPITQYAEGYVDAKIYILGLDGDVGQKVKFVIDTPYEDMYSNNAGCGETIDISNNPQVGVIPVTGDTVSIYVSAIGYTSVEKPFVPTFNNKVYWHTSSDPLLSGEDVINAGAAEITMTLVSGESPRYEGLFTYSRNTYYYIVIDMRNIITCSDGLVGIDSIGSHYPVNVEMNFTSGGVRGISVIDIDTSDAGNVITGVYNNSQVAYVSSGGTGSFTFIKTSADDDTLYLSVTNEGPIEGDVKFEGVCASLSSVALSTVGFDDLLTACSYREDFLTRYFNGVDTYPAVGDYVFTNGSGATYFNGDNKYYYIIGNDSSIKIDSNGGVVSVTSCVCEETSLPVISTTTFPIQLGAASSFKIEATHNPTSWAVVSTVDMVTFNGNETGGVFDYTDENLCSKTLSVGIGETIITPVEYGSITPVSGVDADYAIGGMYVPYGLSIDDNGILQTNFTTPGSYSIALVATNCVGPSDSTTISFTVQHPPTLSPFQMTSVGECSSASACSSTECMSTFWFDGVNCDNECSYPAVNDFVYIDGYKNDILNGGYLYYKMDNNQSILIDGIGQVISVVNCEG
jgi:hypothetical protein